MSRTIDLFTARAEAVSAEVHRFVTKAAALAFIVGFLRDEGVADAPHAHAVWADSPLVTPTDKQRIASQVPGLTFDATRALAADSRIGISQMDWAVADTGSLVQDASAVEQRLVSTLPSIHVALLSSQNVVADLPALLARVHPSQSNYISFITGPSRTADIERVLTIGVHGPERLVIVLVDDLEGGGA